MEVNTQRRAAGLKDKIPDIQKTLDTVRFLQTRKVRHLIHKRLLHELTYTQEDADPLESFFELNDTLFAKASIPRTEEVYLWLGVRLDTAF